MNQRIKELYNKVFAESMNMRWNIEDAEKFAELIVQECAELSKNSQYANTKSEYYEGFNEAMIYIERKIRKHFGVE